MSNLRTPNSTASNKVRQRENGVYIGFVKGNNDFQNMGRLQVYIPELCGDPANSSSWLTVGYATPFGGSTNYTGLKNDQTMAGSQQSYGWWAVPPDLENQVLVCFANGDIAKGYWFACVFQQNMNFMVPGIPAGPATSSSNNKALGPTVEYNKLNVGSTTNPTRPVYTPLATGLTNQGLTSDFERGPASSGARREAPSKVFGFLTPDGSQVYADDNPANEFIRFRTKSGVQVIIHETNGYVYINSKSGNSWIEISDLGVDIYSQNSVSIRAQQDVNIRADRNINMDAGGAINLRAGSDILAQAGGTLQLGSKSGMVLSVSGGQMSLSSSGDLVQHSGGAWRSSSSGDTTMLAGGNMNRTAAQINDNGPAAPSVPATPAKDQPGAMLPNGPSGNTNTTVSRMPAHEPWSGHPKSNVPPIVANPHVDSPGKPSNGTYSNSSAGQSQKTGDGKTNNIPNVDGNQCATGVGTKKCSDSAYNAIQAGASATGAPFGGMMAVADVESGFNPSIQNNGSGATGLYQFIPSTWGGMKTQYGGQYNISSDTAPTDPTANATMGGAYYQQNVKALQNQGVSDPSCGQVYMCHMLGTSGGPKFINAALTNPDAPLGPPAVSQAAIDGNPSWFGGCTTVGQAYSKINGTMNAKAAAYGAQAGLPSPCSRDGGTTTTASNTGASSTNNPPPSSSSGGYNGPPPISSDLGGQG